jgi:carboxypeptidase T
MNIFRFTPLLLSLCFLQIADAQHYFSRVSFPIDESQTLSTLAKAGIDLTHGHGSQRDAFITELQDFEIKRIGELGIRYDILIEDLSAHRNHLKTATPRGGGSFLDCQDHDFNDVVPRNFELGQVGGYFNYSEILDHLDAMSILYPNLISIRRPIGNFKTWQNNSLFWVRISDNPENDEQEPEILYTSLHHAREPISISQNIYYMWYLLENYDKNPLVKQILNNTELYFIPVVNPDGLLYNLAGYDPVEDIFTRNHRKNMRDNNEDGQFNPAEDGVDLNRNYGHEWGHDDEGSSPFPGSDVYRGPEPFSEPETQAVAWFCDQHDFKVALNHHAYGNLLIHPWGYNSSNAKDSVLYDNYAELMTQLNGFVYGLGIETVGYNTNGDSDDWMYGAKQIISMTPEVGDPDEGFYPLSERIIPLCQSALEMNLLAARLINSLVRITDESPDFVHPGVNPLDLEFNRYGLLDGEVQISFNALNPHISQVPAPIHLSLDKFQPHTRNLTFMVDDAIAYGTTAQIEIIHQQGAYTFRDTLTKTRADFTTLIADNGDLSHWNTDDGPRWGLTQAEYKSGPVSITDSPGGVYEPGSNESIVLADLVNLSGASSAYAQFWTRWEVEDHYDYVVFQGTTDGENWENLCGEQSRLGSIFQLYEEPLYDGKQDPWVLETVDLSSYVGHVMQLRFLLVSDGFEEKDGFYFDDFKVVIIEEENVATNDQDEAGFALYPNPAQTNMTIQTPVLTNGQAVVYNSLGQAMTRHALHGSQLVNLDVSAWPSGLYRAIVLSNDHVVYTKSVSITR